MELGLDSKFLAYIAVLLVVVIVAILIFNYRNPTAEEKDANRNKLYLAIGLSILVVTGLYVLLSSSRAMEALGVPSAAAASSRPGEYGLREAWSEYREQKKNAAEARKRAKAAGYSREEVEQAVREAKSDFREVKQAGQKAKFDARQKAAEAVRARRGVEGI